jgi:dipeptidyl aminopeptidase/acylaminoacyl peptidase
VNGPIYFTDGGLNRIDDGMVSTLPSLQAIDQAWSPNGAAVLHVGGAQTGPIYLSTADGAQTAELAEGYHPAWSPDGTMIVFQRDTAGSSPYESDIFVIAPDGSRERNLTASAEYRDVLPSWHPNGTRVLFTRYATDGREDMVGYEPEVVVADVATGFITVIAEGDEAAYSLDGSLIAISRCHGVVVIDGTSYMERYVLDASCFTPSWSRDGSELAYARGGRIAVLDVATGQSRELPPFPAAVFVMQVAWSPDGSELVFIATVPCTNCGEGSQRGVLLTQSVTGVDLPHFLADAPAGSDLAWQPAQP